MKIPMLASVLVFCSCSSDNGASGGSPTADFSKLTPDCFVASTANPIIISGDFSTELSLTTPNWNDPHVIKEGNTYYMYASADDNFNHDIKIYRLSSSDGINWSPNPMTPVLQKSTGQWDAGSTETPAVVKLGNTYHMFWTGYSNYADTSDYKIGHATSVDGINWTKDANYLLAPSDPSASPNLDFDQYLVAEPAPVVFNGKIYLYFTAIGANLSVGTTLEVIGLITSTDGVSWTAPQSALVPDQTLYPGGAPGYYKGYSTPHAAVLNNKMHLFFDVVRSDASDILFSQQKIHHAVSDNGVDNWVHDSKEIIDFTEAAWTQTEVRAPAVYLEGNKLLLWYAGHKLSPAVLGIGIATCSL